MVARICREAGDAGLAERLAGVPGADFQSLMMEVSRQRAANRTPAQVFREYESGAFSRPSLTDPRVAAEFDRVAFEATSPLFTAIELSPVAPLGSVSVPTKVSQDRVLTASRGLEVLSDSTNVLALECALRRKASRAEPVRLCASHRVVRPDGKRKPGDLAHFRLFGMCTAGRNVGSLDFETSAYVEHIRSHLLILKRMLPNAGLRVALTDFLGSAAMDAVQPSLASEFGDVEFVLDPDRTFSQGYYWPLCFMVFAPIRGVESSVADGGLTDWTQQFLGDKKERLMISGIGAERVCGLASAA